MSEITLRSARPARADMERRSAAALRLAGAVRPDVGRRDDPGQERYNQASQWRLMWWRLLRHRVAVACGFLLLAIYATTLVSEILAPYGLDTRNTDFIYAPPQKVRIFDMRPPRRALCRGLRLSPRHDQSEARLHREPRQA
jgi:hypothetical protein